MTTKKQIRYFSIFEYEKEQDYLRAMHKDGWKFVKVSGLGTYHFERCEPQDVVYQLDYNQEGLAHKEEYVQMFRDCGWEYLQDYAGYSYFRKPISETGEKEEIFCDEESRLQMMTRVFKGRMLPLLILFCCVLLPQMILNFFVYQNYLLSAFFGGILLVYVFVFILCAVHYFRYQNKR